MRDLARNNGTKIECMFFIDITYIFQANLIMAENKDNTIATEANAYTDCPHCAQNGQTIATMKTRLEIIDRIIKAPTMFAIGDVDYKIKKQTTFVEDLCQPAIVGFFAGLITGLSAMAFITLGSGKSK
jgi:hypothetical protein